MSKEIIDLLEKAKDPIKGGGNYIDQALTLLKQQPTAGDFTKKIRNFVKLYENEIPRRAEITLLSEACDRLDRAEAINKELLELCEEFMEIADDGSARFDDPEPGSIYLKAEAAIAKAKKGGE